LKLEWVLTIANATGTNGLTCLPKHGVTEHDFMIKGNMKSISI
jgi:hypothetical protein